METGGVPLTGYKLYMVHSGTGVQTLAYDGTNNVAQLEVTLTSLELDVDYEFFITGLNPIEGERSD